MKFHEISWLNCDEISMKFHWWNFTKFQWNFIAFEMDNEISLIMRDQCFFDVSYFELLQCLWTTNCVYFWSYLTILTFTIFWPRGSAVSSHHSSIFLKQCKIQIITIVLLAVYIEHFDEISLKFQWNFIETCEISSLEWDGWNFTSINQPEDFEASRLDP